VTRPVLAFAFLAGLAGCAVRKDYGPYFAHPPRSILIVPALNESTDLEAQAVYMTTISRPLAERGFYVFPVFLVEALLRDLGLPEAGLIHQMPVDRFHDQFGADAVLFVTIKDWSNKYYVVQASTVVTVEFVLRDTRTGLVLWQHTQTVARNSGDGGGNPIAMLIAAAVSYAANQLFEVDYRPLAVQANQLAFTTSRTGLPCGPYHPQFGKDAAQFR
jgi:hypothetical protein